MRVCVVQYRHQHRANQHRNREKLTCATKNINELCVRCLLNQLVHAMFDRLCMRANTFTVAAAAATMPWLQVHWNFTR